MSVTAVYKFSATSLLLILQLAFATTAQEKDPGILTFDEYAKTSHGYPYILELQIGKGSLLYYGSRHTYDPSDSQLLQIQRLWKEFRPTVAFHESTGTSLSRTPQEAVKTSGESGLVRFLAARDKVPYFSLEPSKNNEVSRMLETFTPEQVKVFFVLRQVPQFIERNNDEKIEDFMVTLLRNLSYIRGLETTPPNTIAELEKSCMWLSPHLKDWRTADRSWSDPVATKAYTNQLARLSSEFRDLHMVELLTEKVRQGERVFAVVGGSHVVMQEPALKAAAHAELKRSN